MIGSNCPAEVPTLHSKIVAYCRVYVMTRLGLAASMWLMVVPSVVYKMVKFPGAGQQKVNAS